MQKSSRAVATTSLLLLALLLALAPATASAGSKSKASSPPPAQPANVAATVVESEPNETCATANTIVLGDAVRASIQSVGDVDAFIFSASAGDIVEFRTSPGTSGGSILFDTYLQLFTADCSVELAADDDGHWSGYSRLTHVIPANGNYVIMVTGVGGRTGDYDLSSSLLVPPVNDVCAGAVDLQAQGQSHFQIDLCSYTNALDPGDAGCTGWADVGPDALYSIDLVAGELFTASVWSGSADVALYVLSDCGDPVNSCVAAADDFEADITETLSFVAPTTGSYVFVIDTYAGCDLADVYVDAPVATERKSLGSIKARFD